MTLEQALNAIAAAHEKALELGVRVSVAVLDQGATPIAFGRMDGAMTLSARIAEGKAAGAALKARDGDAILAIAEQRPAFFDSVAELAPFTIVPGPGSLAIKRDGVCVGSIGVSGAKPEEDLECARAGLAAITG